MNVTPSTAIFSMRVTEVSGKDISSSVRNIGKAIMKMNVTLFLEHSIVVVSEIQLLATFLNNACSLLLWTIGKNGQ